MLKRYLPRPRHQRAVRGAQVVLVLLAIYTALSWVEDAPASAPFATERVTLSYAAPVRTTLGPWTEGQVITESSPGIPQGIAPEADLTARYTAQGVQPQSRSWSAVLRMGEADGSSPWWAIDRPLEVTSDGDTARLHLNISAIMAEARGLEVAAHVPGQLAVRIEVTHSSTIDLLGTPVQAVRTATMALENSDGVTLVTLEPGDGTYRRPAENPLPPLPIAALVVAAVLEVALLAGRRTWAPWERVPGVQPVLVHGLVAPTHAGHTDLASLFRVARRTRGTVFVDPDAHLAVLRGTVELSAPIPREPEPAPPAAEPLAQAPEADGTDVPAEPSAPAPAEDADATVAPDAADREPAPETRVSQDAADKPAKPD